MGRDRWWSPGQEESYWGRRRVREKGAGCSRARDTGRQEGMGGREGVVEADKENNEVSKYILEVTNPDNSFSLLRQWTVPEQKTDPSLYKLRLMSYNILAQEYVAAYPELYTSCDREALGWGVRFRGIKREVVMYEPDIVCMQEVQFYLEADSSNHFQSWLQP